MKRLLGEAGFFAYLDALNQPYTRALRVNLLLRPDGTPPCPIDGLGAPVPWAKGAYFVEGDARPVPPARGRPVLYAGTQRPDRRHRA